jgi:hypothetical protein
MDTDYLFWILAAFWLGTCAGFLACALVQAGRNSDTRRARAIRTLHPDLLSDTITRY